MDMSDKKAERPKTCIGELCWNPKTEKLEFEFDRKSCPVEIMKKLEDQTPMIIRSKPPKFDDKP